MGRAAALVATPGASVAQDTASAPAPGDTCSGSGRHGLNAPTGSGFTEPPGAAYASAISTWRPVEIYATFVRLSGEIEVVAPQRLSDAVNRVSDFLELRHAATEPLSVNYPVLSKREARTTVVKSGIIMICPREHVGEPVGNPTMWREKLPQAVAINTGAFTMVADVHLDPRHSLRDHLEMYRTDFLPVTNLSALWIAAPGAETHAVQRPLALVNPRAILSFSPR